MSHRPVFYTFEADTHCPGCTRARFGDACEGTDREGNQVGAVFNWELGDWEFPIACGTCLGVAVESD